VWDALLETTCLSIAELNMSVPVKTLKTRIATGLILSEKHCVSVSIAIDKYLEAQGAGSNTLLTRSKIEGRKRIMLVLLSFIHMGRPKREPWTRPLDTIACPLVQLALKR
jgi:hypothetical protein